MRDFFKIPSFGLEYEYTAPTLDVDTSGLDYEAPSFDFSSVTPSAQSSSKGDFFSNNLGALITGGLGLFSEISRSDAKQEALELARQDQKYKDLLALAQLKYGSKGGGGGGGGGTQRNRNADLIEVLASGNDDRLKALDQFTTGYVGALK